MAKLWEGRFSGALNEAANDFNSSISFDSRMYREDISGSVAHATMLAKQGIISEQDKDDIVRTLTEMKQEIDEGKLKIDMSAEDIHSFVEGELTRRIGDAGKRLHTARSRNDQVATDIRLNLVKEIDEISGLTKELVQALLEQAEQHAETILPGYTHLQRAQPITFGQHLMAYAMMLLRDVSRLADCRRRTNVSPLGSAALAGTTYNIDRMLSAELMGFEGVAENSLDGVSDRDFAIELASANAIIMMHLSRLAEEVILWSSWEFKFVELSDAYSTGSSIMPQKKNPDMAELIRGKSGRAYGTLMALLTMMKGLPLAYNKDMQEDKQAIFESVDTVKACLGICAPMISTMKVNEENMLAAARRGFINATDCADWLVSKGMPFRDAYRVTGALVKYCIGAGKTLEELTLAEFRQFADIFDEGVYAAIDMNACVARRVSRGGTSPESVRKQINIVREKLGV